MRPAVPRLSLWISLALAAACGGTKPAEAPRAENQPEDAPAPSAPAAEEATPPASADSARSATGVPTECFKQGAMCSPDPQFVKRLCNGKFPSVGLYLFSNPKWTRGYLTRRTKAWNASGGASDSGWVEFDEEVLILYARVADAGGMQVSGAGGSFDALRWDGSCVTLQSEEVTMSKAPSPKYPPIDFRYLDDDTQEALRKEEKINKAWQERRKECKGATSGEVSLKCVKADEALTKSVIAFVRGGGSLPEPKKLP
ncbi:MAG: hypothetical protein K0R38_2112 [Polyangiaceae bacterium]|jgi:hypothetical protein|nr:hypothetical protein [Polyangiaceae bacterium]